MFGYLNGFIKGYVKRSNLIDKLIDELGYVKDNARELTPAGDNLLRENFIRFHELMENDSHFG